MNQVKGEDLKFKCGLPNFRGKLFSNWVHVSGRLEGC